MLRELTNEQIEKLHARGWVFRQCDPEPGNWTLGDLVPGEDQKALLEIQLALIDGEIAVRNRTLTATQN